MLYDLSVASRILELYVSNSLRHLQDILHFNSDQLLLV